MTDKKKPKYGLRRAYTRKPAKEYVDFDYLDKLKDHPEAEVFLDRFSREYYQNSFTNTDADLHKTPEQKRKCYSAENARNRDMFSGHHRDDYQSLKFNMGDLRDESDDEDE